MDRRMQSGQSDPIRLRCQKCQRERPPALFRRWRGDKYALQKVCNECCPPRKLSEMTVKQRLNAMARGQALATPAMVAQMNEREHVHRYKVAQSTHKYAHHRALRTAAWNAAITDRVRRELRWASDCASRSTGEFFPAYIALLKRMVDILSRKPLIKGAPLKPTMEEADPASYIPAHTRAELLHLYTTERMEGRYGNMREPTLL